MVGYYETDPKKPGRCIWCGERRDDQPHLLCKECQRKFLPNEDKIRQSS